MVMEGYLTLALGQQKYLDMAVNLAMTLRLTDPTRPICLVHDDSIFLPGNVKCYFDYLMCMPHDANFTGVTNKIRLNRYTPFDRTMYIDADCMMVRDTVGPYWARFKGKSFTLLGQKVIHGRWAVHRIDEIISKFDAPYMVLMNSGVFYFERGSESDRFFALVNRLYRNYADEISHVHQGRSDQYNDEPILGLAMGLMGIEPQPILVDCGSLMVSTWRARRCRFDLAKRQSQIEKPTGFYFRLPLPLLAKGWVRHEPIFAHFINLRPRKAYAALCQQARYLFDGKA